MRWSTVSRLSCAVLGTFLTAACGFAAADSAFGGNASPDPSQGGDAGGSTTKPGAPFTGLANDVILVHASQNQAFRLCFLNEDDRLPQPDRKVMPASNVVGVEVGSAVRIGPLRGAPGRIFLFDEPLIRSLYPAFGGSGASCKALLANSQLVDYATELGDVRADLSRGVHLLVVRGCPKNSKVRTYTATECGPGYDGNVGNLSVMEVTLQGAQRASGDVLPVQLLHFAQPIEGARADQTLRVSYGSLADGGADLAGLSSPILFGKAAEFDKPLRLDANDTAGYGSVGFRVAFQSADGGVTTPLAQLSLADVQRLSSPADVPPSYYAAGSNYVLMLLGDPAAKLADGGADDDALRRPHLLAVPVVDPASGDAGADGSAPVDPTTVDSGT